jgi:(p)ppGpp synthase/HD superfamily hydrolase
MALGIQPGQAGEDYKAQTPSQETDMPLTPCPVRHDASCRSAALRLLSMTRDRSLATRRIRHALAMAAHGHAGQVRRTGEPYLAHPLAVACATLQLEGGADAVITALLHDVMEDCPGVTINYLLRLFGQDIVRGLMALTKRSDLPEPLRVSEAHGRLVQSLRACGPGLALVKLLDRAHNAATSAVLAPGSLSRMQAENQCLFAPLAAHVGAQGLADFLVAEPAHWWQAAVDFPAHIRRIQPPLACMG